MSNLRALSRWLRKENRLRHITDLKKSRRTGRIAKRRMREIILDRETPVTQLIHTTETPNE
jgi:hypothetical protein